jgi:hypothetical protein
MQRALEFKGCDDKLVIATGAHGGKLGGAIFLDSLRGLWRHWDGQTPVNE